MAGTSGGMPYESKKYALKDLGRNRRRISIVRISIHYNGGAGLSDRVWQEMGGEDPTNGFTCRRVHSICNVSILKVCRDRSRIIDANRVVKFEIKYARDGIWQTLAEF